jgi:hypothetical protein
VKTLTADVASMAMASETAFTPPPRAWIAERLKNLNALLANRTEKSALALRRLTGPVTLTPEKPEVGRPYFRIRCNVDSLNLLVAEEGSLRLSAPPASQGRGPSWTPSSTLDSVHFGSNLFRWWSRGGSNPRPPHCERGALPAELRPQRGCGN